MKAELNEIKMVGRLFDAPTVKCDSDGGVMIVARIGCDRGAPVGATPVTDWFDIVARDAAALELAELGKGDKVQIVGRLQNHRFIDKEGRKRVIPEIKVSAAARMDEKKE